MKVLTKVVSKHPLNPAEKQSLSYTGIVFFVAIFLTGMIATDTFTAEDALGARKGRSSRSVKAYIHRGERYMEEGRYRRAVRQFSAAIRRDPQNEKALKLRGKASYGRGHYGRAVSDFTRYLKLRPSDPNAYLWRAHAHNFNLHPEEAVKDYNKTIELNPSAAEAFIGRGLAYSAIGNFEQAIKDYRWAYRLDSSKTEALGNLGRACMLAGRPLEAEHYFKKALEVETSLEWRRNITEWLQELMDNPESRLPRNRARGPVRNPVRQGQLW